MPLLNCVTIGSAPYKLNWIFQEATVISLTNGKLVTLRFISVSPALELKSNWRSRIGCGPVENWTTVENKTGGKVIYNYDEIVSSNLTVVSDSNVSVCRFNKEPVGIVYRHGGVLRDTMAANAQIVSTVSNIDNWTESTMPFVLLDVKSKHGLYIGYGWDFGKFTNSTNNNPNSITTRFSLGNGSFAKENGKILNIPYIFYGTYKGDIDDGCNSMKKWFWNYRITPTLRENNDEPLVEICTGGTEAFVKSHLSNTPWKSMGVDLIKVDWDWTTETSFGEGKGSWDFDPAKWPNGMTLGTIAHANNLKAALYMQNTYNLVNLATVSGRNAQIQALRYRYDNAWYDYWRSDFAVEADNDYLSHEGLLCVVDSLIASRPGWRWELCSSGGTKKSFDLAERMTFMTMEDLGRALSARAAFYTNSYILNPVQLKLEVNFNIENNHTLAFNKYGFRTTLMGANLVALSPNTTLAGDSLELIAAKETWNLYKTKQRPILRGGNVYHILPAPDGINWDGMEYFNPSINRGSIILFKPSNKAIDGDNKVIKLKGLDRNASYNLTFQDRPNLNCKMTGEQLMDKGITVTGMTGDYASEIIWLN